MTLLLLLHAFNCKDLHRSLRRMTYADNPALLGAVALGVATLVPTFYIPIVYTKVFYQARGRREGRGCGCMRACWFVGGRRTAPTSSAHT